MTDTDLITTQAAESAPNGVTSPNGGGAEQETSAAAGARRRPRRGDGLSGMVLAELRALAAELGIKGTSGMRKGELIAAIEERRSGGSQKAQSQAAEAETRPAAGEKSGDGGGKGPRAEGGGASQGEERNGAAADVRSSDADAGERTAKDGADGQAGGARRERGRRGGTENKDEKRGEQKRTDESRRDDAKREDGKRDGRDNESGKQSGRDNESGKQSGRDDDQQGKSDQGDRGGRGRGNNQGPRDDDGEGGGRGRRGRRFRERRRNRDRGDGGDVEIREDDVLQPVAGILDVLDNYAFVRTSGYLPGPNDVYVSMNMVRKNGLRRGDAITGAVRVPREGEQPNQRQKFNPLVRLDTVNGADIESAKKRLDFGKLTPLYPNQRLRLETTQNVLTTRVIDLVMPIGKGQRALIVSPPKAGKTTILQNIANAIATNNPECYLMVVLVDERPEEVTDMQRSVKGEVIASTFDRPPSDHTSVAELAIERAKRLVESGKDVVVLLDSITRLGRAYNNSSPASGRILSGGVDSTALYPPKRFLGAARNIEHGGSLTIIATAMVETGSTGDTVIFEEFKGTGNAELKLDRKIAERRVFPAVDINPSSTRHDELLMAPDEMAVIRKLRRVLSGLDSQQAIDVLIERLKKSKNNVEFLMQVSKTAPGALED